ncbi:heme-binding domain-containing protein [Chitinophaga pendula]|uniref:heme-binding domain-containing protein n=1 Tax=Chitinophaga TaxID=79328 RepID=UPI000BAE85BC|nr:MULTISPECIES: heme-binding domain-containing protein [Chitinophaga]ASZ12202.1 hypothetical protein CK934_15155 [Chitinophaga sp. MD30]UCJ04768.1 heme-binding domain-containing protein [Chitinophaga pendula]
MKESNRTLNKKIYLLAGLLAIVALAIQGFAPRITHPPITSAFQAPDSVTQILKRACYDCHSNETRLKWYDQVAPFSWLVNEHIQKGRSRFNFSSWDSLSAADQQVKLWEMVNMAEQGKMPLPSYAAIHPEAKVSAQDIGVLKAYVRSLATPILTDSSKRQAVQAERDDYKKRQDTAKTLPTSLNGIKYIPDFQQWQVLVTTSRFDNNTTRVVYGNDIAVKAIRENHLNPWPEGSTIVKVVWNNLEDGKGDVRPGTFNNVQIMIKDNKRFPETKGWGFARFNGVHLTNYGKTAQLGNDCFTCHKIAKDYGYVFDIPVTKASQR